MRTHELAKLLLGIEDKEVLLSLDISTCDSDGSRRIFSYDFLGVNDVEESGGVTLMFYAEPEDNTGKSI